MTISGYGDSKTFLPFPIWKMIWIKVMSMKITYVLGSAHWFSGYGVCFILTQSEVQFLVADVWNKTISSIPKQTNGYKNPTPRKDGPTEVHLECRWSGMIISGHNDSHTFWSSSKVNDETHGYLVLVFGQQWPHSSWGMYILTYGVYIGKRKTRNRDWTDDLPTRVGRSTTELCGQCGTQNSVDSSLVASQ